MIYLKILIYLLKIANNILNFIIENINLDKHTKLYKILVKLNSFVKFLLNILNNVYLYFL